MREILFRGKRLDNGEWVEGSLVTMTGPINNGRKYILPTGQGLSFQHHGEQGESIGSFIGVDPETVGQYTGLIDKTGRKIFEGDIIKGVINGGEFDTLEFPAGPVYFENGAFYYRERKNSTPLPIADYVPQMILEVVGNIYDNTELLEGKV